MSWEAARGAMQVGALRALFEAGVKPDLLVGLETVPVIVRDVTDEQEMLILALVENVDRAEMTPI